MDYRPDPIKLIKKMFKIKPMGYIPFTFRNGISQKY
jgi:hypothetical protein